MIEIRSEDLDLLRLRRQPGEIEGDAAQPGVGISISGWLEVGGFEFGEDEAIHGIQRPCGVFDRWRFGITHGLEGPELLSGLEVDGFGLCSHFRHA